MTKTTRTTAPKPDASAAATCACGCGETVERTFKQGHDQRLISYLASDLVHADVWAGTCANILKKSEVRDDIQARMDKVSKYVAEKLSPGLAAKFVSAAHRQWEAQKNKDAKAAKKPVHKRPQRKTSGQKAVDAAMAARENATPSEEAGDAIVPSAAARKASEVKNSRVGKVVTPTATNDDVDQAEAEADGKIGLGVTVRAKIGRVVKDATVVAMNQSGKATVLEYSGRGGKPARTEKFEIVND